jgi:Na+-translocating ferredoxin:NAD+ oxidoreductase RnfE subunit
MSPDYIRIARDGIWDNNVVFAQSLALCPLLAILPPGGFVVLGFILAGKRLLDQGLESRRAKRSSGAPAREPVA